MIHGIYIKNRPKDKWCLVSVTMSPEIASSNVDAILSKAKLEDNQDVQAKIQIFESSFHIPEFLSEIKEQKLMYN